MGRRRLGRVRKLPSGRYQARYLAPDGTDRPAPNTFATKSEAARWLTLKEAELARNSLTVDPAAAEMPLADYAASWIRHRPGLRGKTIVLYDGLLRNHIKPHLGEKRLNQLTGPMLRAWRTDLLDNGLGPVTAAKAYRLLRSILATAVEDRILEYNPCFIKGAPSERSPERPTLTEREVFDLVHGMEPRYRLLKLLAALGSLRWGELAALQRRHIDGARGLIEVRQAVVELPTGELRIGPPKTESGRRDIEVPSLIWKDLQLHLDVYVKPSNDAFVFTGPKGAMLRRSNYQRTWRKGLAKAGLTDRGLHFHDLRHTGNTWHAESGATVRERMGHSSTKAALIYIHSRDGRQRLLAEAMSERLAEALRTDPASESAMH